jgi:hypothetical protein
MDYRQELRLRGTRLNVSIIIVIDEIGYRIITYLRYFDMNLTIVVEERDAYGSA